MKRKPLTRADMTPDQAECFDMLCDVFHGEHHAPEVREFGRGIRGTVYGGQLATFDFDYLTRLVVLAHDRCIRVEVMQGGPGRVGVALWKRKGRDGFISDRHPTIEDAIKRIRPARAVPEPASTASGLPHEAPEPDRKTDRFHPPESFGKSPEAASGGTAK